MKNNNLWSSNIWCKKKGENYDIKYNIIWKGLKKVQIYSLILI